MTEEWSQARRLESWPPPSLSRALADAGSVAASATFVARQPIYDSRMEVYGYELLFRAADESWADVENANEATASTIVTTFGDIGLETLVGGRMCFVNVTREFILNDFVPLLPVGRVGLEMPRDIAADPEVSAKLSELGEMGYIIVLDDFVMRPDSERLLELAHMVKLDAQSFTDEQLRDQIESIAAHKVKLVGERIESYEEFDRCKAAGIGFFQGYFFCQPKTVAGKGIPSNRLAQVQLIAALQNPDVDLEELDAVISRDLGVSYRLLRWINSAYFSLPRKVNSVHEALVLLGARNVRSWAMLVTLAGLDDTPTELTRTAMLRGKMAELVAARARAARYRGVLHRRPVLGDRRLHEHAHGGRPRGAAARPRRVARAPEARGPDGRGPRLGDGVRAGRVRRPGRAGPRRRPDPPRRLRPLAALRRRGVRQRHA